MYKFSKGSSVERHTRPLDIYFTVENNEKGIKEAVKTIKKYNPKRRIVIEATGRLVTIANPAHIKRFAGALGQRAKTDKLDAQLIAHYSEVIQPKLSRLKPDITQAMSDLVTRRNELLTMQATLSTPFKRRFISPSPGTKKRIWLL